MSTSTEKVHQFTVALHRLLIIIEPSPEVTMRTYNTLNQLQDALCAHGNALNELAVYESCEPNARKHLALVLSLQRGIRTNTLIVSFIQAYCGGEAGHPRGLLSHIDETAQMSDMIVRAADQLQMIIHAYMVSIRRV